MLAGYLLFLKITLRSSAICIAVALNFSRKSLTSPFGREVANVKHIKSYHTPEVLSMKQTHLVNCEWVSAGVEFISTSNSLP